MFSEPNILDLKAMLRVSLTRNSKGSAVDENLVKRKFGPHEGDIFF